MHEAPKAAAGRRDVLKELRDRGGMKASGQVLAKCARAEEALMALPIMPVLGRQDNSQMHHMWFYGLPRQSEEGEGMLPASS